MTSPRALSPVSRAEVLSCASPLRPRSSRSLWKSFSEKSPQEEERTTEPAKEELAIQELNYDAAPGDGEFFLVPEDEPAEKCTQPATPPRLSLPCTPRDGKTSRPDALGDEEQATPRGRVSLGRAAWERLRTPSPEITYTPSSRALAGSAALYTPASGTASGPLQQQTATAEWNPPPLNFMLPCAGAPSPHAASPLPSPTSQTVAPQPTPPESPQKAPPGVLATSPTKAREHVVMSYCAPDEAAAWRQMRDYHQGRSQVSQQQAVCQQQQQHFQQQQQQQQYEACLSPCGGYGCGGQQFYQPQWQQQSPDCTSGYAQQSPPQDFCTLATSPVPVTPTALFGGGGIDSRQVRGFENYHCEYEQVNDGYAWADLYVGRVPVEWDEADIYRFHIGAGLNGDTLMRIKWLPVQGDSPSRTKNPATKSAILEYTNYESAEIAVQVLSEHVFMNSFGREGKLTVRFAEKPSPYSSRRADTWRSGPQLAASSKGSGWRPQGRW